MPRAAIAACSAAASGTVKRMPVSVPAVGARLRASDVVGPGGATSIQRNVSLIGASRRFSKPSAST